MHSRQEVPTNADEARALARHYVAKHLERGYTTVDAKREVFAGMSGPGIPGYLIRAGKIGVPGIMPTWFFDFAELAGECVEPQQMTLF